MSHLLVDAVVWNYAAKAQALPDFLRALPLPPVVLTEIARQLRPALGAWPELAAVLDAVNGGEIDSTDLTEEEESLRAQILGECPGLGSADCALLAVARTRGWSVLTNDSALKRHAAGSAIHLVDLFEVLDQAVDSGAMQEIDREWIVYYSRGGTAHRRPRCGF